MGGTRRGALVDSCRGTFAMILIPLGKCLGPGLDYYTPFFFLSLSLFPQPRELAFSFNKIILLI